MLHRLGLMDREKCPDSLDAVGGDGLDKRPRAFVAPPNSGPETPLDQRHRLGQDETVAIRGRRATVRSSRHLIGGSRCPKNQSVSRESGAWVGRSSNVLFARSEERRSSPHRLDGPQSTELRCWSSSASSRRASRQSMRPLVSSVAASSPSSRRSGRRGHGDSAESDPHPPSTTSSQSRCWPDEGASWFSPRPNRLPHRALRRYLSSTSPPASSRSALSFSASSRSRPSLTGPGAASTTALASLRPRPVAARTALMT